MKKSRAKSPFFEGQGKPCLEHIIVSNINKHLAFESILADCQHGFRSQRSCETQLVQFYHDMVSNLDGARDRGQKQTDVIIVDFAKAFDKVPSKGTSPFTPMGEITVDPKGVLKLLNNLNIHKASGPDGLSARVLKEWSSEISPVLALIYNESLAQGTVPDDWRQANVAPVFKKGEKYNAANYRPVSLTCICCKTLEARAYNSKQHKQALSL